MTSPAPSLKVIVPESNILPLAVANVLTLTFLPLAATALLRR